MDAPQENAADDGISLLAITSVLLHHRRLILGVATGLALCAEQLREPAARPRAVAGRSRVRAAGERVAIGQALGHVILAVSRACE
jgi:hypothetical protein